jgi:hypothetical protein
MPLGFTGAAKRPDFLIASLDRPMAVDVKFRTPRSDGAVRMDAKDVCLLAGFERLFGIPTWLAFLQGETAAERWYFKRVSDVLLLSGGRRMFVELTADDLVQRASDLKSRIAELELACGLRALGRRIRPRRSLR